MSNVTLTIGSNSYKVACSDGEEAHVMALGEAINQRLAGMGDVATGRNETRNLLFAALLLADELHELGQQAKAAPAAPPPPAPVAAPVADNDDVLPMLTDLAARMENLASSLEDLAANA